MRRLQIEEFARSPWLLAVIVGLGVASWLPISWLTHNAVSFAAIAAATPFYWLHCAGPSLYYSGATPQTMRLIKLVGAFSLGIFAVVTAFNSVVGQAPAPLLGVMVAAEVWYLAAWPLPRLVGRFSGGVDPLEGARRSDARRAAQDPIASRDIQRR